MATSVEAGFPAQSEGARPSTAPAHGRRVRFKEPLVQEPPSSPCSTSSPSSAHSSAQCSPVTPLAPSPLRPGSALSSSKPGHPSPSALPLTMTPRLKDQLGYRTPPQGDPPRASTSASHRPTSGLPAPPLVGAPGVPAHRQLAGQAGGHPSSRFMVGPSAVHSAQERGHPPALGANPASNLKPAVAHAPNLTPFNPGPRMGSQIETSPPRFLRPNLPHTNLPHANLPHANLQHANPPHANQPHPNPTQQKPVLEGASASAKAQPRVLPQHPAVAPPRPPALHNDSQRASAATHATPAAHSKHSVTELKQVAQAAAAVATGCWSYDGMHLKVPLTPPMSAHPAPSSNPAPMPASGTPMAPAPVSAARPRPATSAPDPATLAALQQMQNKVRRMEWELGRRKVGETKATVVAKWGRLAFGAARAGRQQVQGQLEGAQRQVQTLEERQRDLQSSLHFLALEGQDHRDLLLNLQTQLAASEAEAAVWRQREAELQARLDAVRRDLAQVEEGGAVADSHVTGLQAEERGLEESTKEASEGARASELSQAVLTDLRDELARHLQRVEDENRALLERNTRLEELVQKLDLGTGPSNPPSSCPGGTDAMHRTATWDASSSTPRLGEDRGRGASPLPRPSEGELLGQLSRTRAMLMESEQKRFALFMRHSVGDAMTKELQLKLQEAGRRIQFLETHSGPSTGAVEAWRVHEELQREKETNEYLKEKLIESRTQERMLAKRVENLETLVKGWGENPKDGNIMNTLKNQCPKNGDMDVDSRSTSSQGDMEELYELANIC